MTRVLALIVAPAAFWLLYHYYKDRHRPEPFASLLLTYLGGVAAGLVCLRVFEALSRVGLDAGPEDGRLAFLLYCLLGVGLVEESAKLAPFLLLSMRLKDFDEPIDGIVYASVAALGFASYENYEYLAFLGGTEMAARAVASPLTHAVFASIWGDAAGRAKQAGVARTRRILTALLVAAAAHGLYDFVAVGLPALFRPATATIILAIWIWRLRTIRRMQDEARNAPGVSG